MAAFFIVETRSGINELAPGLPTDLRKLREERGTQTVLVSMKIEGRATRLPKLEPAPKEREEWASSIGVRSTYIARQEDS